MSTDSSYVMWFDTSKQPTEAKIADAVANYRRRFPAYTGVLRVLVHPKDVVEVEDVLIESASHIQQNNYWVTRA